jgi:hypothetical protein
MPKSLLWAFLLGLYSPAKAQILRIDGKIENHAKLNDSIELNVPLVGDYYKSNSTFAPIDSSGKFRFEIHSNTAKFAQILYGKQSKWVLLAPGRSLFI